MDNSAKQIARKKNSGFQQLCKHKGLFMLMIPGLIALIIFKYLPMVGTVIAFKDFRVLDGIWGSQWVGLENFRELFKNQKFLNSLKNTLTFSVVKFLIGIPAPIILALMLNEVRNIWAKKIFQTLSYLPHFFSWVILGGLIKVVFSYTGPINSILNSLGMQSVEFFAREDTFFWMIIWSAVWAGLGWGAIIYMATLSGIDMSLYEAAEIDGAGKFKQMLYITLPCLLPTVVVVTILNLGNIMNAGFDQIYNMQNPLVYNISEVIETYNLRKLQELDYSYGTAVGLFKSVIGLILVLSTNAISRKVSGSGLW